MLMFMHVTNMNGMYLEWYVVWYILFMRPPKHKQKAFGSILLRLVSFGMLNTIVHRIMLNKKTGGHYGFLLCSSYKKEGQ